MTEYKLLIFVDREGLDSETYTQLSKLYQQSIVEFNINQSTIYPDAGFDLYVANKTNVLGTDQNPQVSSVKVSHNIKIAMYKRESSTVENMTEWTPTSYYMYPRSSFSKTSLCLGNHTGIFDSGYRGHVIMAVRNLAPATHCINQFDRLMQICTPTLSQMKVQLVDRLEDLNYCGIPLRGEGGFGSTGIGIEI